MRTTHHGFTLVEMMISITIGLFLAGGLLTLVQSMKGSSLVQGNLSQLQDNERLAMRVMTDVIQATGDYPTPAVNSTASGAFPALTWNGYVFGKGQTIAGKQGGTAGAPLDSIAVRYSSLGGASLGGDGVSNCIGGQNPSLVTTVTFVNAFSIDANGNLQCQLTTITNGVASPTVTATLVGGVKNLNIMYGLKTNTTNKFTSIDAYLDANQVAGLPNPPGYLFPWVFIKSVRLTLYFNNPLQQNSTIQLMRVINVMNQVGET